MCNVRRAGAADSWRWRASFGRQIINQRASDDKRRRVDGGGATTAGRRRVCTREITATWRPGSGPAGPRPSPPSTTAAAAEALYRTQTTRPRPPRGRSPGSKVACRRRTDGVLPDWTGRRTGYRSKRPPPSLPKPTRHKTPLSFVGKESVPKIIINDTISLFF